MNFKTVFLPHGWQLSDWLPVCAQLLLSLSPWLLLVLTPYLTPLWPVSVSIISLLCGIVLREFFYPDGMPTGRFQQKVFSLLWLLLLLIFSVIAFWPLRHGLPG